MVGRVQVQDLARGQLTPQARPADLYYRPNRERPELNVLTDFAPLSSQLQRFLRDKAERDSNRAVEQGRIAAVEQPELADQIAAQVTSQDPEERRKQTSRAFRKLVRDGKIPEAANPLWQIGFAQNSAQSVMGRYRVNLQNRLAETEQLVGPDGLPQEPADANQIIQEEFAKLQDNPALANFYGSQVAARVKQQVDENFLATAAKRRAAAMERQNTELLQNDIAGRLDLMEASDAVPGSEDMRAMVRDLEGYVSEQVFENGVRNPREVFMMGARVAIQRARNGSAEDGLRLLEVVEDVQIEGSRLGDDGGEIGLELARLKAQLHEQEEQDIRRDRLKVAEKRAQAVQEFETTYVSVLQDALDNPNASISALTDKLISDLENDPEADPEVLGFQKEAVRAYALKIQNSRQTDPDVVDSFYDKIARGELGMAEEYLRSVATDGETELLGRDHLKMREDLDAARSVSRFMENNGVFQGMVGLLKNPPGLKGFAAGRQDELDGFSDDRELALRVDFSEFVRSTEGQGDREGLHRAWLNERVKVEREALRQKREELQAAQDEAVGDIFNDFRGGVDATDKINRAAAEGRIDLVTAEELRDRNQRASDRAAFFNGREFTGALTLLQGRLSTSDVVQGELTPEEQVELGTRLERQVRSKANAWLTENRPNLDPARVKEEFAAALPEIVDEVTADLTSISSELVGRRIDEGATALEAVQGQTEVARQLTEADAWNSAFANGPGGFGADSPLIRRHPRVPGKVYRRVADYMSGRGTLLGGRMTREEVFRTISREATEVARGPLNDAEKSAAVTSMYSLVGLRPEFVLEGEIAVELPEGDRAIQESRREHARRMEELGFNTVGMRPTDQQILDLGRELDARERVPLDLGQVNPYVSTFFRDAREMEEFQRTRPADWDAMLEKLGVPPTPEGEREFIRRQILALDRARPD